MKVIAICGSARKNANSTRLAEEVLKGAADEGAVTKLFQTKDMEMDGCLGCFECKEAGHCVQIDDMTPLYGEINEADAVVFASPIYMFEMTGQLKLVVDRLFAYLGPDFRSRMPLGKKLGLVFTQGMPDVDGFKSYFESVADILHRLGFNEPTGTIVGAGLGAAGMADDDAALLKSARSLGRQLAQ